MKTIKANLLSYGKKTHHISVNDAKCTSRNI
uniref:Uncharacterized protein n=1 Tax=Anguilla anguilla TaxID=7936 RepID=A0A0E9W5G9_ANGAN